LVNIEDIYDIEDDEYVSSSVKYDYDSDSAIYYWRVRSYDRFQYSDFGYTGRFRCNTRPSTPTNLSVRNEV
jgi:hypothetical protein